MPENPSPQQSKASRKRPNFRSYRYTFLGADREEIMGALELFIASDDAARKLALELLEKSAAASVEVWTQGALVSKVANPCQRPA